MELDRRRRRGSRPAITGVVAALVWTTTVALPVAAQEPREPARVTVGDVTVAEDAGPAVFEVTLDRATAGDVELVLSTGGGNATPDVDYVRLVDEVRTIPAGATSITVAVEIVDDGDGEDDETVLLLAEEVRGAVFADSSGEATIVDDDPESPPPPGPPSGTREAESARPERFAAEVEPSDATVTWDFGDGTPPVVGNPVEHAFVDEGTYEVVATAEVDGGTATQRIVVTVEDSGVVTRSSGSDRVLTAVQASRDNWGSADTVVLARADDFADALAGGPLAAALDAPLLLTPFAVLPSQVETELARLGADRVVVLGGTAAVSTAVAGRLDALGVEVERIAGGDRFATAAAVADQLDVPAGGEVVVALGTHPDPSMAWPDALSAGSFAATADLVPVLLTTPDAVPEATASALAAIDPASVVLLGGPDAVSEAGETRLEDLVGEVERVAGEDRYATSAAVVRRVLRDRPAGQVNLVVVTGADFADGLAAGAVAGRRGGVVLLVPPSTADVGTATIDLLAAFASRFDVGTVVGGELAVTEPTRRLVEATITRS